MPYRLAIAQQYKKWWRGADSNCRTLRERIYSPPRLATSLPLRIVNYKLIIIHKKKKWCRPEDLNPQPTDYKSVALPVELGRHRNLSWFISLNMPRHNNGGGCRARTCDPLLVRQVLSQLS